VCIYLTITMAGSLTDVKSSEEFAQAVASSARVVAMFSVDWSEPCQQLQKVVERLAQKHSNVSFLKVSPEEVPSVAEKLHVSVVPHFVFFVSGQKTDSVEGASAPRVVEQVEKLASSDILTLQANKEGSDKAALEEKLKALISYAPVMLFMKGTPDEPKCGFSRKMVEALKGQNIAFSSFNILEDLEVRQGLKEYSNWPTYPQVYINGKLIGGLDVVNELIEEEEFKNIVGTPSDSSSSSSAVEPLEERLKKLINKHQVMLFMKGDPSAPRCGFSRKMVELLNRNNVPFGHFDILSDEEVRQGLKEYSNWPTYPQLYSNGKLVGGLDVVVALDEEGELGEALA